MVEAAPGTNFFVRWSGPTTIQRGQMRKAPVMYSLATSRAAIILSWTDRGTKHTKEFDID